jgi:hypothetical protein
MDRDRIEELISAHLDGELEPNETAELESLLQESKEARGLLESYRNQGQALAKLPGLKAPDNLKTALREKTAAEALQKAGSVQAPPELIQKRKRRGWVWIVSSAAACFLFLFLAEATDPGAEVRFYLSQNGITHLRGQTETFVLSPTKGNLVSLVSPKFQAKFTSGTATVSWSADAGTLKGQAMHARLHLDLDGDDVYDVVEESVRLELDSSEGFEKMVASFPLDGIWDEHGLGQAKVELICDDESAEGVSVKLHPGHSHLMLPLARFQPV